MSLDWTPPHKHTKHWNKSLQRRLVVVRVLTGEDLLGVPGRHGYSRSVREPQPVGDRCDRMPRNVDIVESRCNVPQPSMRHDDDDDWFNPGKLDFYPVKNRGMTGAEWWSVNHIRSLRSAIPLSRTFYVVTANKLLKLMCCLATKMMSHAKVFSCNVLDQ